MSFTCFGRMAEPIEFVYDGSTHVNDLSHCDYTPLKGIIRWQECQDDWEAMAKMYARALQKMQSLPDASRSTHSKKKKVRK